MNLDKFSKMVSEPARSEQELKTILENVLNKGAREHALVVKEALNHRFPGWDTVKSRKGGAKPAIARFLGQEQTFPSSKDAYIWLIERFVVAKPSVFDDPSNETIYLALGKRRNYFGKNLKKMFHGSPKLAENPSNYTQPRLSISHFSLI